MGKTYKDAKEAKDARRFRNKAEREGMKHVPTVSRARRAVELREAIRDDAMASPADRRALTTDWQNREGGLGEYWKQKNSAPSAVTIIRP